jgi:hypothetical protein
MPFSDRTRGVAGRAGDVAANAASTARRQARRAQLEIEHRRLDSRIRKAYADIGRALYPLVEKGQLGAESPEIQSAAATLSGLLASDRANREEIERLGGPMPIGEPSFPHSGESFPPTE